MKCKLGIAVFCCFVVNLMCFAQQNGIDALKKDYPQLMEKFGRELENQRADYYFLVDVSGTMQQYTNVVVPALQEFFRSMQTDDYVSVIRFGGAAKNDIGSQGKVNEGVVKNLIEYVPNLYRVPNNPAEKALYYNHTDLHVMLQYLAKEMHMPGLNNLKFVFIITDFIHDPANENKGKENWEAIRKQLQNEQHENHLFVFALQLPGKGAGRDLDKVRSAFPVPIELEEVQDKSALSEWFSHKKNHILLDKFTALVRHKKNVDTQAGIIPEFSKDGNLTLHTSWVPNELFEQLSVGEVALHDPRFHFESQLPVVLNTEQGSVHAGNVAYQSVSFPFLRTYGDSLTVYMYPETPYANELAKLGIEPPPAVSCTIAAKTTVFTFWLPFWWTIAILALIILYAICVIRAFMRNRSARYKITGTFVVRNQGDEVIRKKAVAQQQVDIGSGASFLPVAHHDCSWLIELKSVTSSCFLFFKKPEYRVFMRKGNRFKTNGREYLMMHHPRIARGTSMVIDDFSIKWIP